MPACVHAQELQGFPSNVSGRDHQSRVNRHSMDGCTLVPALLMRARLNHANAESDLRQRILLGLHDMSEGLGSYLDVHQAGNCLPVQPSSVCPQ